MREGVRLADVRHPIQVAAELPTEPAMPPTRRSDVTDFSTDARPPGGRLPESLGEAAEEVDEQDEVSAEIVDHLRDIRQGLVTVLAELDQIGESTTALLSARLYFVEFTETADGPDFASELADVATKARHLQRILAAASSRAGVQ